MERDHEAGVIELGIASLETRGQPIYTPLRENEGYVFMGLLDD